MVENYRRNWQISKKYRIIVAIVFIHLIGIPIMVSNSIVKDGKILVDSWAYSIFALTFPASIIIIVYWYKHMIPKNIVEESSKKNVFKSCLYGFIAGLMIVIPLIVIYYGIIWISNSIPDYFKESLFYPLIFSFFLIFTLYNLLDFLIGIVDPFTSEEINKLLE